MAKQYLLIDPEYVPPNIAGKSEELDRLARTKVLRRFQDYQQMRNITAGGKVTNLKRRWDELYKLYMSVRDESAHNYLGQAQIFVPVTRRAVNIIESEASNALFGRDDYFSVEASMGDLVQQMDMTDHAYNVLKHYSDTEDYISPFELALKQNLIYGATATRVTFKVAHLENIQRTVEMVPITDEITKQPLVDEEGKPKTRTIFNMQRVVTELKRPKVEAIDIYKLFINPVINNPEDDDIVYQNMMSRTKLLEYADTGVYDKKAVYDLLKQAPSQFADQTQTNDGMGKASLIQLVTQDRESNKYEILQYEGWFVPDPKSPNPDDPPRPRQFFIDIGNRNIVLRCQENPLIGQYKTFSLCNYDSMIGEFYTDGVIDPIKGIQYEINDKENQSIDAVSFDLNAPFEVVRSAGLTDVDIMQVYNVPHKALFVRERDSIRKIQAPVNVSHLSMEVTRLLGYVDNVTGSTSLAAGAPTGTQADRSGKALGLLQNQTRSQFSRLIRKFERMILEKTLQKCWKMIMQYSDEDIAMKIEDEDGNKINQLLSPAEIIGEYTVKVSGGSEYLKESEMRDSMLQFMSVLGMNDVFMSQIDPVPLLKSIAEASPYDMSGFINPNNLYQKQKTQIDQLTQAVQQSTDQLKIYGNEIVRLQGALKQTQKANDANAPVTSPMSKTQGASSAGQQSFI